MMKIGHILLGIGNEPEIGRVLLVVGVGATVVTPVVFEALDMYHNGWHFDVTAWCLAYPGGLVALVAGGVIAIASKEKSVAQARSIVAQPPLSDKTGTEA